MNSSFTRAALTACMAMTVLACAPAVHADDTTPVPGGSIVFCRGNNVGIPLATRIANHVQTSTGVGVMLMLTPPVKADGLSVRKLAALVKLGASAGEHARVALVSQPVVPSVGPLACGSGIIVVNINALRDEKVTEDVMAEERFLRRVESVTMQGVGLSYGLKQCGNPHCCMYPVMKARWDLRGRGFGPPCLQKMGKVIHAGGTASPAPKP